MAASEAGRAITLAHSIGLPIRPSGIADSKCLIISGVEKTDGMVCRLRQRPNRIDADTNCDHFVSRPCPELILKNTSVIRWIEIKHVSLQWSKHWRRPGQFATLLFCQRPATIFCKPLIA